MSQLLPLHPALCWTCTLTLPGLVFPELYLDRCPRHVCSARMPVHRCSPLNIVLRRRPTTRLRSTATEPPAPLFP